MVNYRMRFPGGLSKAFTMSYDDGVETDIRLIEIMRKNGVKGTFNINAGCYAPEGTVYPKGQVHRRMPLSKCLETYQGDDVEVAVHGYEHPWLEALPAPVMVGQVLDDRRALEKDFHRIIRGMAYPYGTYSDDVVNALALCGIAYSRTTEAHLSFKIPTDWLRMGATCHHIHPKCPELIETFVTETPRNDPWLFYLWGHSYEFDGQNNWELIETLLSRVGNREDVWYATNIQIYDYVQAFKGLIHSSLGDLVYNPSSIDVWAEYDLRGRRATLRIPAGQTVEIQ